MVVVDLETEFNHAAGLLSRSAYILVCKQHKACPVS